MNNEIQSKLIQIENNMSDIISMFTPFPCKEIVYVCNVFRDIDNPGIIIDGSFCYFMFENEQWRNIDEMLAENVLDEFRHNMKKLYLQWLDVNAELEKSTPSAMIFIIDREYGGEMITYNYKPVHTKEAYEAGISPFDYNNYLRYKYMEIQPSNEREKAGIDKIENL